MVIGFTSGLHQVRIRFSREDEWPQSSSSPSNRRPPRRKSPKQETRYHRSIRVKSCSTTSWSPWGLTQNALAKALKVTPIRINHIVRGQRSVTADTALRLSRYFGTRPGWWLDLQSHYDLQIASDQVEERIAQTVSPCRLLPVAQTAAR